MEALDFYKVLKKDLHMVFINWDKAYDRVPREITWKCLEKKDMSIDYIGLLHICMRGTGKS